MKKAIEQSYEDIRKQIEALRRNPPRYAVVFFDLAGSTEFKARRDLTTSLLKVYRHNAQIEEEIGKHQGKLVKSLGDGILATFEVKDPEDIGYPLAAVIRIMRDFEKQGRGLSNEERIVSRVGMTVGPVVDFAAINPRGKEVADPQGSVVDLAARLCTLAAPSQVLCDQSVRSLAASAGQEFTFGNVGHRAVKGFDAPIEIGALKWGDQAPLDVAYSPPTYSPDGFLTAQFVLEEVRKSKALTVVTGFSHRHFCDNIELLNIVSEKARQVPDYRLVLVFLHPNSEFKAYASHVTRRRVTDLTPAIVENLEKACRLYEPVCGNVSLRCSHYPMIVPLVQRDDMVHFGLPLRSQHVNGRLEGVVGGGWFSVHTGTRLGQRIVENLSADKQVEIPVKRVAGGQISVSEVLRE